MSLLRPGDLLPWHSMLIVDPAAERGSEVLIPTRTRTRLPSHGASLVGVVEAFERADSLLLRKALDAADEVMLNYIPLHYQTSSFEGTPPYYMCYFNAIPTCFDILHTADQATRVAGAFPASLLSSVTFALLWRDDDEDYAWTCEHTMDEWISTYITLINHPKIDINKHCSIDAYRDALAAKMNSLGDDKTVVRTHEDHMTAIDYALDAVLVSQRRGDERRLEVSCRIFEALVLTGKVDLTGGFHRWQDGEDISASYICTANLMRVVRECNERFQEDAIIFDNAPFSNAPFHVLRPDLLYTMMCGWKKRLTNTLHSLQRGRVIRCMRRIARVQILLARWWDEARGVAYAPG